MIKQILRFSIALILVVAGMTAFSGAAYAADSTTGAATAPGEAAAPVPVLVCHITVNNPHNSKHVGGTINVTASINCTGVTPAKLFISVTLYKIACTPTCHDVGYGNPGTGTSYGKSSVSANSATVSCTPGQYFGAAYGVVTAPPGVKPPVGNISSVGRTVTISC